MPSEVYIQNTLELESLLAGSRALIEVELNNLLPSSASAPEKIHQAIRWSVFAGGKRFQARIAVGNWPGVQRVDRGFDQDGVCV